MSLSIYLAVRRIVTILTAPDDGATISETDDDAVRNRTDTEQVIHPVPSNDSWDMPPNAEHLLPQRHDFTQEPTTSVNDDSITIKRRKLGELISAAAQQATTSVLDQLRPTHEDGPSTSSAIYQPPNSPTTSEIATAYRGNVKNSSLCS